MSGLKCGQIELEVGSFQVVHGAEVLKWKLGVSVQKLANALDLRSNP